MIRFWSHGPSSPQDSPLSSDGTCDRGGTALAVTWLKAEVSMGWLSCSSSLSWLLKTLKVISTSCSGRSGVPRLVFVILFCCLGLSVG